MLSLFVRNWAQHVAQSFVNVVDAESSPHVPGARWGVLSPEGGSGTKITVFCAQLQKYETHGHKTGTVG